MTEAVEGELNWWVQNLHLTKGKTLVSASPQLVIAANASIRGWGAFARDKKLGTLDSFGKEGSYKCSTFTGMYIKVKSIHIQIHNIVALSNFAKMGRGYTKQNHHYLEQGNMGVLIGQGDQD